MLTWINKQGVKSDTGFVVQSVDRFVIEYREGDKKRSLYVERGRTPEGSLCVDIAPDAFAQWDGDATNLSVAKQAEMLSNFIEAMKFQEIEVVINETMRNDM